MFDTIVAIASGNINQAISIIRISGPESLEIINKIFDKKITKIRELKLGYIIDENDEKIDQVLVSLFVAPLSFTGEDVVEINSHGGIIITKKILEIILANGARLANPGEFTRRAVMNGKMNLIKAEAINELVNAKTNLQAKIAISKFGNRSSEMIKNFLSQLENLIGICEVNIDYPEYEDVENLEHKNFLKIIENLLKKMKKIIDESEKNQVFLETIKVALVGRPNVGKSSLLNKIINEEKSIVTELAGTTRDVVEGEIIFNNLSLKILDTAGIRQAENIIEKIGIDKTWETIENSDLVLHVLDASKEENEYDEKIENIAKDKQYFKIFNKTDLVKNLKKENGKIYISLKENDTQDLINHLENHFTHTTIEFKNFLNERQLSLMKKSFLALKDACKATHEGITYDIVIVDILQSWEALKEILGKVDKEDLLDSIFKNFCLGK